MTGADLLVRILKAEGVRQCFCFPNSPIIEAMARAGLRVITTRQERVAGNMADGVSRSTNGREIGVFTVQALAGAENAFAGVAQAHTDSTPVLWPVILELPGDVCAAPLEGAPPPYALGGGRNAADLGRPGRARSPAPSPARERPSCAWKHHDAAKSCCRDDWRTTSGSRLLSDVTRCPRGRSRRGQRARSEASAHPSHAASRPSPVHMPRTAGSPAVTPATGAMKARVTKAWARKPNITVSPTATRWPVPGRSRL